MSDKLGRSRPFHKPAAPKKLAEHLTALNSQNNATLDMEKDMLSLIVSGVLNGEDLSQRYPTFHRKLLENAELRQAFLDALEAVEAERANEMTPLPSKSRASLAFLTRQTSTPALEIFDQQQWRATWQRTLEQIQAVFSPPELAYRSVTDVLEEPWFTLLREEIKTGEVVYDVILDCTLPAELENTLAAYLNLAVTLNSTSAAVQFPLRANLQWGEYQKSVLLTEEGRVKFPDIPLKQIYDSAQGELRSGLNLTLETTA